MQRLRLQPPTPEDRTTRQAVLLASAPGSLALLAPLALPPGWEAAPTVAALRALLRELALLRPQAAGLNPGAFRCASAAGLLAGRPCQGLGTEPNWRGIHACRQNN